MEPLQTENEVMAALKAKVGTFPSQRAAAMDIGISDAYLSDALLQKRGIGPIILQWIAFKKVPMYAKEASHD